MFQLAFPQPEMLSQIDLQKITDMMYYGASKVAIRAAAEDIRRDMNPHPANQKTENVPQSDGIKMSGMQHKYRETVLFFPSEVCRCHSRYLTTLFHVWTTANST
jgi:L-lysine 2,3-aminomutase